jgi:hypothetical protein
MMEYDAKVDGRNLLITLTSEGRAGVLRYDVH